MRDIVVNLQQQIITNLKSHWRYNSEVDLTALQDISESSHNRAIVVLTQLQERIHTSGRIDNCTPSLLKFRTSIDHTLLSSHNPGQFSSEMIASDLPADPPLTPQSTQSSISHFHYRESPWASTEGILFVDRRDAYKPIATTTSKAGIFGIGKRTKVEPVVSPPENPLVDEYLATAIEDVSTRLSRTNSISTVRTSLYEHETHHANSLQVYGSPISSRRKSQSIKQSFGSLRRVPTANLEVLGSQRSLSSIYPKNDLPSELNGYAGFCKGAFRQQIGDRTKAMEERGRPGVGMYNAAKFWQCKNCRFEGRSVPIDKKRTGYDLRVFRLVEGIQFRWEFMFKSHVMTKDISFDPAKALFGCVFCCAEGRGTPKYSGYVFSSLFIPHSYQCGICKT